MRRTHHCSALRPAHIGQTVTLQGWVHSRRDLGGVIFLDVRDREGRTQTVFDPSESSAALVDSPAATNNPKIPTGEIEIAASALEVLNMADVLPFSVDEPEAASKVNEELRLK